MSFSDVVWSILIAFAFVAYLMIMFSIITDLFRDRDTGGVAKAIWIIALIFLPLLTSLVYLITRGRGMAERSARQAESLRRAQDDHIREVVASNPADQITKAKALLDSGAISSQEYEALKAKTLA